MKLIFRQSVLQATELDPETLTLREFEQPISQGSVMGADNIQEVSPTTVNIMVNANLTYWAVPRDVFEVISDQQPIQANRCCG